MFNENFFEKFLTMNCGLIKNLKNLLHIKFFLKDNIIY